MGQLLAVWKWRAMWPFRSESLVVQRLANDRSPIALTRFDAHAFADEIRLAFGDGDDAPFVIDVCDFAGHRANWIILSSGWSTPDETLRELARMCSSRRLHLHAGS